MRRHFTLIELLIVIAIIAILAGMLLPALGKVRDTAYLTQCASKCSTVGRAFYAYTDDYNGFWPTVRTGDPSLTTSLGYKWYTVSDVLLKDPVYDRTPCKGSPILAILSVYANWRDAKTPYAAKRPKSHMLECPSRKTTQLNVGLNSCYGLNTTYVDGNTSPGCQSVQKTPYPTRTMVVGEATAAMMIFTGQSYEINSQSLAFPHNRRGNVYFVDGHLEAKNMENTPHKLTTKTGFDYVNGNTYFWTGKTPGTGFFAGM